MKLAATTMVLLVGVFLLAVVASTIQQETRPQASPAAQPQVSAAAVVSSIEGTVTVGSTCPTQTGTATGSRPLAGAVVELRFPHGGISRTTSRQDGSYVFIWQGGGTYTVAGEPVAGTLATPSPVILNVTAGTSTHVDLCYIGVKP